MFRPGIVICSRAKSERVPGKCFKKINNKPLLAHLLEQCSKVNIPTILAIPKEDVGIYQENINSYSSKIFVSDHSEDPLARQLEVAQSFNFTHVVRITHDKIFIDYEALQEALEIVKENTTIDYLYCPNLIPGTGFEIISTRCLKDASSKYKNVEHVSYAVRLTSKNTRGFSLKREMDPIPNLLIDFPEDLKLIEVIMSQIGDDADLYKAISYLNKNQILSAINCPPLVTVYTCVKNGEEFLQKAMMSVSQQRYFDEMFEYIIIDDASTDRTCELMAKFALGKKNVFWFRNNENIGLASCSNFALKKARGKYLVRLDADDYFINSGSVMSMVEFAENTNDEIVYPDNYFGSRDRIQKGREQHHVGGALFNKKALNFVKFTDGLRNYDGLDLFERANDKLKIGYYEKPVFFYTQHPNSMSKTNLKERMEIKRRILERSL